jgi:hypothetical protein
MAGIIFGCKLPGDFDLETIANWFIEEYADEDFLQEALYSTGVDLLDGYLLYEPGTGPDTNRYIVLKKFEVGNSIQEEPMEIIQPTSMQVTKFKKWVKEVIGEYKYGQWLITYDK